MFRPYRIYCTTELEFIVHLVYRYIFVLNLEINDDDDYSEGAIF